MMNFRIENYPLLLEWFDKTVNETIEGKITPLTWAMHNLCDDIPLKEIEEKLTYLLVEIFEGMGSLRLAVEALRLYWPKPQPKEVYIQSLLYIPLELLSLMIHFTEGVLENRVAKVDYDRRVSHSVTVS